MTLLYVCGLAAAGEFHALHPAGATYNSYPAHLNDLGEVMVVGSGDLDYVSIWDGTNLVSMNETFGVPYAYANHLTESGHAVVELFDLDGRETWGIYDSLFGLVEFVFEPIGYADRPVVSEWGLLAYQTSVGNEEIIELLTFDASEQISFSADSSTVYHVSPDGFDSTGRLIHHRHVDQFDSTGAYTHNQLQVRAATTEGDTLLLSADEPDGVQFEVSRLLGDWVVLDAYAGPARVASVYNVLDGRTIVPEIRTDPLSDDAFTEVGVYDVTDDGDVLGYASVGWSRQWVWYRDAQTGLTSFVGPYANVSAQFATADYILVSAEDANYAVDVGVYQVQGPDLIIHHTGYAHSRGAAYAYVSSVYQTVVLLTVADADNQRRGVRWDVADDTDTTLVTGSGYEFALYEMNSHGDFTFTAHLDDGAEYGDAWLYTEDLFTGGGGGDTGTTPPDEDGDGVPDAEDLCPEIQDPDQLDGDGDRIGDACDVCPLGNDEADADMDGTPDACDACPEDAYGDSDGDGACDGADRCPFDPADDADADGACADTDPCPLDAEDDLDLDGVCGDVDACPADPANDADGDGVCGDADLCLGDDHADADGDGAPDACDVCPADDANDADGDGVCGDVDPCPLDADDDSDGDGSCDHDDLCPADPADDGDADGLCADVDACPVDAANDADGDGFCEADDNCDLVANSDQIDTDGDAAGDACEPDTDADGVIDDLDVCPLDADPGQADRDHDGIGDACERDTDGDGVSDDVDVCAGSTGVVDATGCSLEQLVPCNGTWKNHGAYQSTLARTANRFYASGLVTAAERDALVSAGAARSCGKR